MPRVQGRAALPVLAAVFGSIGLVLLIVAGVGVALVAAPIAPTSAPTGPWWI